MGKNSTVLPGRKENKNEEGVAHLCSVGPTTIKGETQHTIKYAPPLQRVKLHFDSDDV